MDAGLSVGRQDDATRSNRTSRTGAGGGDVAKAATEGKREASGAKLRRQFLGRRTHRGCQGSAADAGCPDQTEKLWHSAHVWSQPPSPCNARVFDPRPGRRQALRESSAPGVAPSARARPQTAAGRSATVCWSGPQIKQSKSTPLLPTKYCKMLLFLWTQ